MSLKGKVAIVAGGNSGIGMESAVALRARGKGVMGASFFEQPILYGPYEAPLFHHALDEYGQPLDVPPVEGRRRSEIITPVPSASATVAN
jgi:NAD(P)-dependent dehydrogenase (short-subunit alcohol dehydrogenase family)